MASLVQLLGRTILVPFVLSLVLCTESILAKQEAIGLIDSKQRSSSRVASSFPGQPRP